MSIFDKIWSKPVDRDKYASLITDLLKSYGVDVASYDVDSFALRTRESGTMYLDNGYARYCAATPKDRDAVMENFASALALPKEEVPDNFDEAKSKVMPLIRSAAYYSIIDLMSRADGGTLAEPAIQKLTGDLVVGFGYDCERTVDHIIKANIDKWQISFEDARSAAELNLRDITDSSCIVEHSPGLYLIATNDSYDSSRLLLTEFFENLPLYGNPVAFLPDRDHVWIAGANDTVALALMLKFGEETHLDAYTLSAGLFTLSEGKWYRWQPTEPSLARTHREIFRRRQAIDYSQQKELLNKLNERENVDLFVASYSLYDPGDGEEFYSSCVWSKDIPSLLPETDRVILFIDPESKDRLTVSWTVLQSTLTEPLQRVPGLFPRRFRAYTFPNTEQISALRIQSL